MLLIIKSSVTSFLELSTPMILTDLEPLARP